MKLFISSFLVLTSALTFAKSIKEFSPYEYNVFFTNPKCEAYPYAETTYANDGSLLLGKPANVYCKYGDKKQNIDREDSPNFNIRKVIENADVKELFLTYLSFSDSKVADSLCSAIEERNVKVTLIVDSKNDTVERRNQGAMAKFDQVSNCKPKKSRLSKNEKPNHPRTYTRGNIGGLGYAHNKIIMAKYKSDDKKITLVFSSGNMSSGTVLHHENWHFLTTSTETYLASAHECIKEGMLNNASSKSEFKKYIKECRSKIKIQPEDDLKLFIVPSDGKVAMENIVKNFKNSIKIDVAVHRFTHRSLINSMIEATKFKKDVRLVVDDDVFWAGKLNETVGSSMPFEANNMNKVRRAGTKVKYMETNESGRLLHHNKYIVFTLKDGTKAVHTGAGNFTSAAFSKNFENYYFITIPEITDKFSKQFNYMYGELATDYYKLPNVYSNP